ncbi:MAG: hypothetical protein BWY00_01483 [Firmicutes bacterium ADurb.Bin153]|nr:MAG: hypothetical protein BWY00_01483 [Firmicutes bacterium ADurb.Bin153]
MQYLPSVGYPEYLRYSVYTGTIWVYMSFIWSSEYLSDTNSLKRGYMVYMERSLIIPLAKSQVPKYCP